LFVASAAHTRNQRREDKRKKKKRERKTRKEKKANAKNVPYYKTLTSTETKSAHKKPISFVILKQRRNFNGEIKICI